ncbi:GEVED domain-containing protein [Chryseobacterium defluvii]|uniref:Putative secreted protein (Por secretion system target) n=1 Tax=Chryseobacterium defluvii TaxID=160396 RepID=A0A495SMH8_9FLAO|nr:GEVED domain-containing protein [Chryseobacterium defluvii]RKT00925.1 putative secreted protein (Por secretion system target) [Chryseobacterium defluvii]
MKKIFTSFFFLCLFVVTSAQWKPAAFYGEKLRARSDIKNYFALDISELRSQLTGAQEMGKNAKPVTISLPTLDGKMERFAVYSFPVVVKALADQYQLGSYVGVGIDDPGKYLRFSLAPDDFQSMIIKNGQYEFIEPVDQAKTVYGVHPKTDKSNEGFLCSTKEDPAYQKELEKLYQNGKSFANQSNNFAKNSDKKYRTMRLAMSVTGEYTQYFGGVAGALAAINATLTRVNGVFEKDFALHLNLQNYPALIYTDPATDPYSPAAQMNNWNVQLQQTLTANVGNANYDIGHLFGASGGGGNAGCIGCVCVNPTSSTSQQKGSGYTSPADGIPQGDNFDIDYVAHEMGHQLGGNHTFSHALEGSGVNVEPGSGSTIMGYAGITGPNTDVQPHSDPYFHNVSIKQVQTNLINKTCDIETAITNNPPVIAALPTYNIPKGTAFVLTASVTDPENDPMTYTWEEVDNASVTINKNNLGTTTSGASFRSFNPTTNPTRYFPKFSSVLAGVLNNANNTWESVSTVARTSKFAITVRDNNPAANQQQTQYAEQTIIVGNDGPFTVTTTTAYNNGPTNVTWNVANTSAAPYSVANVKIDFSSDNGNTWTVLTASTANDGNEDLNFGSLPVGTNIKIKVSAVGNVFYAIGNAVMASLAVCTSAPPAGVAVSAITQTQATVTWNSSVGATYVIRYRPVGSATWLQTTSATNTVVLSPLTQGTKYEVQVANVCSGTQGNFSPSVIFITALQPYCPVTSNNSNGHITNVTVSPTNSYSMSNNSGASLYTDYATNPATLITLVRNTANNTVSVSRFIPSSTYATSIWIDFNGNGVFENTATERVMNLGYSNTTPVTATFNVPATTATSIVKMRVIMSYLTISNPCSNLTGSGGGEIEDYAVEFVDMQPCTTAAPSNINVANITASTATVSWIGTTGATYVLRYRQIGSPTWITVNPATNPYVISGLTGQTQYEVQVSTICGGTQGPFSASTNFTTPAISYCNSGTATVTDGYINNITMTGINTPIMSNNSGPSTYTDYSNDPAKLITLGRNTTGNILSVGRTILSGTYSTYAWIDFNGDGLFNNNPSTTPGGERIMNLGYSSTTPVTANFAVPANAYIGANKLKMRVIVYYLTPTDACSPLTSNGEVEDYQVKFVDIPACTTAAPTGITMSNIAATTATVSWLGATGATYYVRWRTTSPVGAWITSPLVTTNSYNITGLTEQTAYEVQVSTVCGGTQGPWSTSTLFTTTPITYCPMVGTGTNDHISNVTITPVNPGIPPMSNTSVQTNYISYTTPATLVTLDIGSNGNKISVAKGWTGSTYNDAVSAWIDFNRNGVFETTEQILNSAASTTSPVTALFNVPTTAYNGPLTTTMRVVLKRTSSPVMCQNALNGEVEDYAVKLRPCASTTPNAPTFNTITHNSAIVNLTGAANNITYLVQYRVAGTTAWTDVYASTLLGNVPLTLTGLTPATTYEVQVSAVCGNTPGAPTAIKTFTTRCDPTPPSVTISNITTNSAQITWTPLAASSTYVMRYRVVGTTTWTTVNLPAPPINTYTLGGLSPYTTYEVQIANVCNGETTVNPYSNPKVFTTERTCELPPPGLTITTLTPTSAVVVWDPFPGATYILRYRKVGIPSWTTIAVPTNTYTLTNLVELTKYEMQVANVCSGTPGNFTPPYYFTTPTVIYCQMSGQSSATDYISKVTVKPNGKPNMENASVASNYTDYSGNPATFIELIQGSTGNQISIEKTVTNEAGVAVWIDFDRSGTFDPNERIVAAGPNTTTPITGTFNVPANAFVSMTDYKYVVMRVAMQRGGIPVNCTSFPYGEVEDYTVRISKLPVATGLNQDDIMIYPNPVSSVLYVKNISKKAQYKIYNAAGQLVANGILLNNQINVSKLINGVYVIDIEDVKGNVQKKFIKE